MKNIRTKIATIISTHLAKTFIVILATAVMPFQDLVACTIVTMAKGEQMLIGNNEDWTDPRTKMWFYPAANGEYGRVCFGFSKDFGFPQGGINDQGLFLDANGLEPTGWQPDPSVVRLN